MRPGAEPTGARGLRAGELRDYLGIGRGLHAPAAHHFAPPPEPPPPPERLLRVLVVADPAEDAHLPGAEEEGLRVAELFEPRRTGPIEVVRLFGPRRATRTEVLRRLLLERFHVMHFAGHSSTTPRTRPPRAGSSPTARSCRRTSCAASTACPSSSFRTPASRASRRPLRRALRRACALVRRVVLRAWRRQLRLHSLAGRRQRRARIRRRALRRPAWLAGGARRRWAAADLPGDGRSTPHDRRRTGRRALLGRLSALWRPALPARRAGVP